MASKQPEPYFYARLGKHLGVQPEGVSAAFIRELMRKATLMAAEETADAAVRDQHIMSALDELLIAGGPLTARLLGTVRTG